MIWSIGRKHKRADTVDEVISHLPRIRVLGHCIARSSRNRRRREDSRYDGIRTRVQSARMRLANSYAGIPWKVI